ncbi:tetratricopeptide repeat protein [uncultured Alsobacter sp.]|uniref:tetratricopeptide repeat protein n=1 Tax=uncultured Alsobacter sp. TaxID=1748258 RepID=UPI0025D9B0D6|nr:tetratricopeptide repeat protein [uncultured Alsobacter sp.]
MRRRAGLAAAGLLLLAGLARAQTGTPASPTAPQSLAPPAAPAELQAPEASTRPDVDFAYAAYQRGLYLTAFREATRRIEADPNDSAAMTLIGELYANGFGVRQDWSKAADWYRLASQRGDPQASYALAMQMLDGRGVPKDSAGGRRLLATAADKVPAAAYAMGLLLLEDNKPESDRRAASLMRFAADASESEAQYAMALLYRQGRGVEKDPSEMLLWMARAAANRSAAAQVDYGIMLFNGDVVPKNEEAAARYFQRAAERGNAVAQNRLARLYASGRGVSKNLIEAGKWHLLANERGVADGFLDQILRDMKPEDRARSEEAARKWRGD